MIKEINYTGIVTKIFILKRQISESIIWVAFMVYQKKKQKKPSSRPRNCNPQKLMGINDT